MSLLFIEIIILILYFRTYKYNNLIDDQTPRSGVLLVIGNRPDHYSFYDKQRPIMATITNVVVLMAVCGYIYILWGFWPSLLFAVLPTNVCGTAWNTGNYYMSTVLLNLCSHWFILKFGLIGIGIGSAFYTAALGSTVNAIPYAFVLMLLKPSWQNALIFLPLLSFLFGYRFQTGLKLRKENHKLIRVETGKISLSRIFIMVRVTAYYIMLNFWPSRLGFFHDFSNMPEAHSEKPNRLFFLSAILIALFTYLGWQYSPEGTIWFLLFIGVFSQFTTFGQFVAERYMVVANVGFCIIVYSYFKNYENILWIISTLWFCISWGYIRAYKNNVSLFSHSIVSFPNCPSNYNNLASHYLERGQRDKAIEPLMCALHFTKFNSSGTHINLANCYSSVGHFQKALHHTQEALKGCAEDLKEGLVNQQKDLQARVEKIEQNKRTLKKYGII